MSRERPIKVLLAKLGLDIHWRGVVMLSRFLRDAGMEVIYLGNQFPEGIAAAALQESPDVVGLSTLSGNHLTLGPKLAKRLQEMGMEDVLVIMGGVIPFQDFPELKRQGITEIFGPDTPMEEIVRFIQEKIWNRHSSAAK